MELEAVKITTERQLVAALAARGRVVSLSDVGNWRKNGLLPPLVSHGRGPAQGKIYCWHERDIFARAVTIFDAIKCQGRADHAVLMLFLSGFEVALPKFQRAWATRLKQRRLPAIRQAAGMVTALSTPMLLLQPVLAMGAALQLEENSAFVTQAVEHGLARLGYGRCSDAPQLCGIMTILALALENSDVIRKAKAGELRDAQRYLTIVLKFLEGGMQKHEKLTEAIGPTLFAFILALLRSGQAAMLDGIVTRIDGLDRRVLAPVHSIRASARNANAAL